MIRYKQTDRYSRFSQGYPAALAELIPSVVIRNKTFFDKDLDGQYYEEYRLIESEDEKAKWLEARVAERRVITEVSLLVPLLHRHH